jgi:hypothetical protein
MFHGRFFQNGVAPQPFCTAKLFPMFKQHLKSLLFCTLFGRISKKSPLAAEGDNEMQEQKATSVTGIVRPGQELLFAPTSRSIRVGSPFYIYFCEAP